VGWRQAGELTVAGEDVPVEPAKKSKPAKKKRSPEQTKADLVCRSWWDASDPKPNPAGGFVGARKIIATFLVAGWSGEDIGRALLTLDTLANWSLEKALKNGENRRPKATDSIHAEALAELRRREERAKDPMAAVWNSDLYEYDR